MQNNNADVYVRQLNETIEKWINYLDGYTLEMLCQKPGAGEWSLGQVYVHIIADTRFYIEQIKAALLTADNSDKDMHKNAKWILDNNSFPDIKIANPANSPDLPQPESKAELLRGLTEIKDDINRLHTQIDLAAATGKTEHPGFEFFSALEWLRFAEMHMRHHLRQKKRIDDELFGNLFEITT